MRAFSSKARAGYHAFVIDLILNRFIYLFEDLIRPIIGSRYRDACPCCVASFLDVECQGQFNDTETSVSQTAIESAQEDFIKGTTPVLAGLGSLLALCWILACCCCRSILKQVRMVLCSSPAVLGTINMTKLLLVRRWCEPNLNLVSSPPLFCLDSA